VWKVDAFREGERDYTKIEGDTGPLVYPAGFLYVYSAIKFLTAGQVFPAQVTLSLLRFVSAVASTIS
jgi:alpha-1,3-mannosyltransferase